MMSCLHATKNLSIPLVWRWGLHVDMYADSNYADTVGEKRAVYDVAMMLRGDVVNYMSRMEWAVVSSKTDA